MIDIVLLTVIGLSALLGLLRGFVSIVVGTVSWLLAGWATFQFGDEAAIWLAGGAHPTTSESLGGYVLVFVAVLVAVAVLGSLIRAAVAAVRLNGADRVFGLGLGLLRGLFFACLLVLLAGFTPLAREPVWQQSRVLPLLLPVTHWMRAQLPDWSVPKLDLGKLPLAGDNGALEQALPLSSIRDSMARALDRTAVDQDAREGDPKRALPGNIDPAQARAGNSDPERVESPGQARPPSQ